MGLKGTEVDTFTPVADSLFLYPQRTSVDMAAEVRIGRGTQ